MTHYPVWLLLAMLSAVVGCSTTPDAPTVWNLDDGARIAEQHFAEGDRLFEANEYWEAHLKYEAGFKAAPHHSRAKAILKRQYEMAHSLIYGPDADDGSGFLGMGRTEREVGVKILEAIVDQVGRAVADRLAGKPGLKLCAPMEEASRELAKDYFQKGEFDEARIHFQALHENFESFPQAIYTHTALWYVAECSFRMSEGARYDEQLLANAFEVFETYRTEYAVTGTRKQREHAEARLKEIWNLRAEKRYLTAQHYLKQGELASAQLYCEAVLTEYRGSDWIDSATLLMTQIQAKRLERREVE